MSSYCDLWLIDWCSISLYPYIPAWHLNSPCLSCCLLASFKCHGVKDPPLTNEYLRVCLQMKESHYYMKQTHAEETVHLQTGGGRGRGDQLIHTQQSIPLFCFGFRHFFFLSLVTLVSHFIIHC